MVLQGLEKGFVQLVLLYLDLKVSEFVFLFWFFYEDAGVQQFQVFILELDHCEFMVRRRVWHKLFNPRSFFYLDMFNGLF